MNNDERQSASNREELAALSGDTTHLDTDVDIKQRLNLQTGKIAWHELARFFAAGKAIFVDSSLDLIDVAAAMHDDEAIKIKTFMEKQLLGPVDDARASLWSDQNIELWAVVVSPWVLVQVPSK